jgi:2'-5' RNA ligase
MEMYFVALVAPPAINEKVLTWKQKMQQEYDCRVALKSPAHVTLISPFWMNEALEKDLQHALNEFSKKQASFTVSLCNFDFFEPRVIFLRVEENENLEDLHQRLQQHLISLAFPVKKDCFEFHPHITIATRDLHKKDFYAAKEYFIKKEFSATWSVNSISLLKHNKIKWEVICSSHFLTQ